MMRLAFLSCIFYSTVLEVWVAALGVSRGFGSSSSSKTNIKNVASPPPTTRASMESNIQEKISKLDGLRESMALIEEIRDYNLLVEKNMNVDTGSTDDLMKQKAERLGKLGWDKERCSLKLHEITWDESAIFRSQRHQTQEVSKKLDEFMMQVATECMSAESGSILDVGCGDGILIDYIKSAHKDARVEDIFGVDISSEMIKIACKKHPKAQFTHSDFLSYRLQHKFSTIVFSECFHYFDRHSALKHAIDLLEANGKIIISHPRGMNNVFLQHATNKFLVPSLLPSSREVLELAKEFNHDVLVAPSVSATDPYLAIFLKK